MTELAGRLLGLISRKFIIVILATAAMFTGKIDGLTWAGIVTSYLVADQIQTNLAKPRIGTQ